MYIQHLLRPGPAMQAVDILGQSPDRVEMALHLGDDIVRPVGNGPAHGALELQDECQVISGPAKHGSGECLLDGHPAGSLRPDYTGRPGHDKWAVPNRPRGRRR